MSLWAMKSINRRSLCLSLKSKSVWACMDASLTDDLSSLFKQPPIAKGLQSEREHGKRS